MGRESVTVCVAYSSLLWEGVQVCWCDMGAGWGLCAICGCLNSYSRVKAQENLLH